MHQAESKKSQLRLLKCNVISFYLLGKPVLLSPASCEKAMLTCTHSQLIPQHTQQLRHPAQSQLLCQSCGDSKPQTAEN